MTGCYTREKYDSTFRQYLLDIGQLMGPETKPNNNNRGNVVGNRIADSFLDDRDRNSNEHFEEDDFFQFNTFDAGIENAKFEPF